MVGIRSAVGHAVVGSCSMASHMMVGHEVASCLTVAAQQ